MTTKGYNRDRLFHPILADERVCICLVGVDGHQHNAAVGVDLLPVNKSEKREKNLSVVKQKEQQKDN